MNARASTSNPPPKFTKSFLPPPDSSRSRSFASSPIRTSRDGVPPAKRRRLASTPTSSSLSLSTPRSSSSRPEQPTPSDLHDARTASSMRVLNIWSALAERYNRRIDEDDIVDIRTGEIIKDRGVLSELPKRYNFGDLADKDDDPAINTDPGSEAADNLAEDEEDEDEDDVEETDAFPTSDGLVSPQITRLAPLRPATSSSDADDLRRFLEAEAIRRELDGGDDSSEEEFSILPPRSTPAKRTMTPAKTPFTARAKYRPLRTPAPGSESEDEFATLDFDRNYAHRGYRARRTPSPEVLASIPSPPPPSSSPGPSSSFSPPSSPLSSRTPRNSNRDPQTEERLGSPTPKRKPPRRTIEDSLNEIDLEFPPPQPHAPSIFRKKHSSAFIIDLSLSDAETEGERPKPTAQTTPNPKPVPPEPRTARKSGSTLTSGRPVPFVLIETQRRTPVTPAPTAVASGSASAPTDLEPVTPPPPAKGKPRTRSSKDKPPDLGTLQSPKRGGGNKARLVKDRSQEKCRDVLASGSTLLRTDETPIKRGMKKVKSSSLSSDSSPEVTTKPKGKRSSTRFAPSDDELGSGSESPFTKRIPSPKSSPVSRKQVVPPESDSRPKSVRKSAAKQKFSKSTRFAESCASTATIKPKSKNHRKPPEVLVDIEGDDRSSPPLPPSPSPAPPTRPRVRSALKRKRRISSGPSSAEDRYSPEADPDVNRNQARTITSDVIDIDGDDHGDNAETGESKAQTRSQSRSKTTKEAAPTPAPANTPPVTTSSTGIRREGDTQNHIDGSHTHIPSPPPLPVGPLSQAHQSFTCYSGHPPPLQGHTPNFNHVPYPNHDHNQYGHGSYPLFQDPNTQALLAQAVTQLAVLMNGGRPQQMGQIGGGNMPATNGFPGSPGWGAFPVWPPSTPTTSRYPYGYDPQQRSFQGPYVSHDQMGSGAGPSVTSSTPFPPSDTFLSSLSHPERPQVTQETGVVQEGTTRRARSRSKSKRTVSFVLDPRSGSGPTNKADDPGETSKRGAEGSPPTTRSSSRTRGAGRGRGKLRTTRQGKSKVDEADQGSELDAGDSDEGGVSVERSSPPRTRSRARGRTPGRPVRR